MDTRSLVAASPSSTGESVGDICDIIASVGAVAYRWHIDSDDLAWSANAGSVLNIADMGTVGTGRAFAHLLVPGAAQSRHDAVMSPSLPDPGTGVPYQVQYAISPSAAATPLWIEDTGRWFGGQDGRPAYAHGILRVINERRAQHDRLAYLARFDELTGEVHPSPLTDLFDGGTE